MQTALLIPRCHLHYHRLLGINETLINLGTILTIIFPLIIGDEQKNY